MTDVIDTSVLVAGMVGAEQFHDLCREMIVRRFQHEPLCIYLHGIAETFSTLTGGRKPFQMPSSLAADFLETDFVTKLTVIFLTPSKTLRAMRDAQARGVRGGGIFDRSPATRRASHAPRGF